MYIVNCLNILKQTIEISYEKFYTTSNLTIIASIRTTRKGEAINPILRDFYINKCVNKKKKVALVAVMHKLLNYIFAVLRDGKPFEIRKPEDHQSWRKAKIQLVAA